MSDKPSFWDFYRAYRNGKKEDDALYVYEKNEVNMVKYMMPPYKERRRWHIALLLIPLAAYLAIVVPMFVLKLPGVIFWLGVVTDLTFLGLIISHLLMLAVTNTCTQE